MPVLALSTAESKLAAVTKGISEGMGAQAVFRDFGRHLNLHVLSDATAASGICRRQGLGRIRHLAVADLWCQDVVRSKAAKLDKWPGKQNPADLFTKFLARDEIVAHLRRMGMYSVEGRSTIAPVRSGTEPCVIPTEFEQESEPIPTCASLEVSHERFGSGGHSGLGGGGSKPDP